MLNFNVLYTSFTPYTDCTDLYNLIYLPILVNIINVSHCVLSKNLLRNPTCLFIYVLFRVLIYILNLSTLPILLLISIITILMCLINRIYLLLPFYCVNK